MAWLRFRPYLQFHFGLFSFYYRASRLKFDSFATALPKPDSPRAGCWSASLALVRRVSARAFLAGAAELASRRARALLYCPHLFVIAGFTPWWGGHSFGARYTTGLVPWFVLLGLLGAKALLVWRERHSGAVGLLQWRVPLFVGGALLVLSILINGRGGITPDTLRWNVHPKNMRYPSALGLATPASLAYGIDEENTDITTVPDFSISTMTYIAVLREISAANPVRYNLRQVGAPHRHSIR